MASIRITIETDGDEFHHQGRSAHLAIGREVEAVLRRIATDFRRYGTASIPRDSNGDVCGKVEAID